MAQIVAKLTVLFQEPFWVGVYERSEGRRYEACRIVFGAEPRDCEVYAYLLDNWDRLRFSPAIETECAPEKRRNPKRARREARRMVSRTGAGTKAQQALQQMREQMKTERRVRSRDEKEAEKERRFALRCEKRREKHAGH